MSVPRTKRNGHSFHFITLQVKKFSIFNATTNNQNENNNQPVEQHSCVLYILLQIFLAVFYILLWCWQQCCMCVVHCVVAMVAAFCIVPWHWCWHSCTSCAGTLYDGIVHCAVALHFVVLGCCTMCCSVECHATVSSLLPKWKLKKAVCVRHGQL